MRRCCQVLLIALLAVPAVRGNDDPIYDGKPLSEWLKLVQGGVGVVDIQDRLEAAAIIRNLGPGDAAAVPQLIKALRSDSRVTQLYVRPALQNIGAAALPSLQQCLKDRESTTRAGALSVLGDMGKEASKTLPDVRSALKDENVSVRIAAALAVVRISEKPEEALPVLTDALVNSKDVSARSEAIRALETVGPRAKPAVPVLVKTLTDQEETLRLPAAIALSAIDTSVKEALPVLLASIRVGEVARFPAVMERTRTTTAQTALVRYGAAAVPGLVEILKDSRLSEDLPGGGGPGGWGGRNSPRATAASILARIGPAAKEAVPALLAVLKERDYSLTENVRHALERMGPDALPLIIRALKDVSLQPAVAQVLADRGRKITPELLRAAQDRDSNIRAGALHTLADRRYWGDEVQKAIRKALEDDSSLVRVTAAETLWRMDRAQAPTVVALLMKLMKDEDATVRQRAAEALGRIAPTLKDLAETMGQALKDRDPSVRRAAAQALQRLGADAKPAAAALRAAVKDEDRVVRLSVSLALSHVDPTATQAIPPLLEAWKQGYSRGRYRYFADEADPLTDAIRRFGAATGPGLIEILGDRQLDTDPDDPRAEGESSIRAQVAQLLGEVGKGNREVLVALNGALADDNKTVAGAAATALIRLEPRSGRALTVLLERVRDGKPCPGLNEAFQVLGAEVVPALLVILRDRSVPEPEEQPIRFRPTRGPRSRVIDILVAMGPKVEGVVPALLEALADEDIQPAAVRALTPLADSLLPRLRKALQAENPTTRHGAALVLLSQKAEQEQALKVIVEVLPRMSTQVKIRTCRALAQARLGAPAVVEALAKLLRGPETAVAVEAAQSLGQLGTAARPAVKDLVATLKSPELKLRRQSALALSRIDRKAEEAIPVLLDMLRNPSQDEDRRRGGLGAFRTREDSSATQALLRFGPAAVEGLVKLLQDKNVRPPGRGRGTASNPRAQAADVLGMMAEEARTAVPALREALKDNSLVIRRSAAIALSLIDPSVEEVIPLLVSQLGSSRLNFSRGGWGGERGQSSVEPAALARYGKRAVPALLELLKEPASAEITESSLPRSLVGRLGRDARLPAIETLGLMGAEAREAVPLLRKLLQGDEADIRQEAALALWRIERKSEGTLSLMLEGLGGFGDQDFPAGSRRGGGPGRNRFLQALGEMGPDAREAVPLLIDLAEEQFSRPGPGLDRWGESVRVPYLETLGRIGPEARAALPLLRRLQEQQPGAVALALYRIEGKAEPALVLVRKALEKSPGDAFEAIHELGLAAKPLLPDLKKLLTREGTGPVQAAECVLRLEPGNREALAALRKGVLAAEMTVQLEALRALERLGVGASALQTEVKTASEDLQPQVRVLARKVQRILEAK